MDEDFPTYTATASGQRAISGDNITATSGNNTSSQPRPPRPMEKEKVKEQLQGYIIVPRDQWDTISAGNHIRYINTAGKYHTGAFVRDTYAREGQKYFQLENRRFGKSGDQGYSTWPLPYDEIKHLYKKIPTGSATEFNMVRKELVSTKNQIEEIRNEIFNESNSRFQLEGRIEKLESELTSIKALLNRIINGEKK